MTEQLRLRRDAMPEAAAFEILQILNRIDGPNERIEVFWNGSRTPEVVRAEELIRFVAIGMNPGEARSQRFTQSIQDFQAIVLNLQDRGVDIQALDSKVDTDGHLGGPRPGLPRRQPSSQERDA